MENGLHELDDLDNLYNLGVLIGIESSSLSL
jgi:hypothetical protein